MCNRPSGSFIRYSQLVTHCNTWSDRMAGNGMSLISSPTCPIVLLPRPRFGIRFVAFYKVLVSRFFSCSPLFSSRHLTTSSTQYSLSLSTRNDLPAASQFSHLRYIWHLWIPLRSSMQFSRPSRRHLQIRHPTPPTLQVTLRELKLASPTV